MAVLIATLLLAAPRQQIIVDNPGDAQAYAVSNDGGHGATLYGDGIVRLWQFQKAHHAYAHLVGTFAAHGQSEPLLQPDIAMSGGGAHVATATLVPFGKADWVAWTPSGDIAGTPGGLHHLYRLEAGMSHPVTHPRSPEKVSRAMTG